MPCVGTSLIKCGGDGIRSAAGSSHGAGRPETVTEINENGVAKEVERKIFPGYVLIKMVMTDDTSFPFVLYLVSEWTVCFRQKGQYFFISSRSGSFFLFLKERAPPLHTPR